MKRFTRLLLVGMAVASCLFCCVACRGGSDITQEQEPPTSQDNPKEDPHVGQETKFSVPQNLTVQKGVFSWTAEESAESFTVKINDVTVTVYEAEYDLNVGQTLSEGKYYLTVKVNAAVGKEESDYAAEIAYVVVSEPQIKPQKPLSIPENVCVSGKFLQWDSVEGAETYTVTLGKSELTVETNMLDLTAPEVLKLLKAGENELRVKADATKTALESACSATVVYVLNPPLNVPANVRISGNVFVWDAVDGADGYTVKIGESEVTAISNALDLTAEEIKKLLRLGENILCVKATSAGDYTDSGYSEEVVYRYQIPLPSPANVKLDGSVLRWDPVEHAESYTVRIGETERTVFVTSLDLASPEIVKLLSVGDNHLTVRANGAGNYLNSAYSAETVYRYKIPFQTPSDLKIRQNVLTWSAVSGADRYTVKVGDVGLTTDKPELDLTSDAVVALLKAGENPLSVKANATADYLESEFSQSIVYTFKIPFSVPDGVEIRDGVLYWNAVEGAKSYTVKIGEGELTTEQTELDLSSPDVTELLKPGDNALSVKAKADGYYLESEYSESVVYKYRIPLAVPENVTVKDGVLYWDAVAGAETYTVKIGTQELKTNQIFLDLNVRELLTVGDNVLFVKANETADNLESAYSGQVVYRYKVPLPAPQNVSVDGHVLTWDAVEGASTYTVVIGKAECSVGETKLDLTSPQATALLARGENQIFVRADGTEYNLASELSSCVTYVYRVAYETEAQEFEAAVAAIVPERVGAENLLTAAKEKYKTLSDEAVKISKDAISLLVEKDAAYFSVLVSAVSNADMGMTSEALDGISEAIVHAENYYKNILSEEMTAAAVKLLQEKRAAFETLKSELVKQVTAFQEAVGAIGSTVEAKESIDDLDGAISAAEELENTLSASARSCYQKEIASAHVLLENAKNTLSEWWVAVSLAKSALVWEGSVVTDDQAEQAIDEIPAKISLSETYPLYIRNEVAEEIGALTEKLASAKESLQKSVTALKNKITALIQTLEPQTADLEIYGQLGEYLESISALGDYAQTLWEESTTELVVSARNSMLNVPVKTTALRSTVLIGRMGAEGKIYEFRTYQNILGEHKLSEPPQITTGENVRAEIAYSEQTESYVYTVYFPRPEEGNVEVSYQIGTEQTTVFTLTAPAAAIYTNEETNRLFVDGRAILYGAVSDMPLFFDLYDASALNVSDRNGEVFATAAPILSAIPVQKVMTEEEFCGLLARNGLTGTYSVRAVFYGYSEREGVRRYSCINGCSVSEVLNVELSDDDLRLPILSMLNGRWQPEKDGVFCALEQFAGKENLISRIRLCVYDTEGKDAGMYDFIGSDTPFAVFEFDLSRTTDVLWQDVQFVIRDAWKRLTERKSKYNFVFTLQLLKSDKAEALRYTDSAAVYATGFDKKRIVIPCTMTFPVSPSVLSDKIYDDGTFELIATENAESFYAQFNGLTEVCVTAENAAEHLEILFSVYEQGGNLLWSTGLPFRSGGLNYRAMILLWTKDFYKEPSNIIGQAVTFTMELRIGVKGTSALAAFFPTPSQPVKVGGTKKEVLERDALAAPREIQLRFAEQNGKGMFEFVRSAYGNGSVFAIGVSHIEIIFEREGKEFRAYLYREGRELLLYTDKQKTSASLACGEITAGQVDVAAFNAWVRKNYAALKDFDFSMWEYRTKVISDGSFYGSDGEESEPTSWAKDTDGAAVPLF